MNHLRIGARVTLGFGLLWGLLVLLAAVGYTGILRQGSDVTTFLRGDLALNADANDVRYHVGNLRRFEKDSVLTVGKGDKLAEYKTKWEESFKAAQAALDKASKETQDAKTLAEIATLRRELTNYGNGFLAFQADLASGKYPGPAEAYAGTDAFRQFARDMEKTLNALVKQTEVAAALTQKAVEQTGTRTGQIMAGVGVLALLAGLVVATLITQSIRQPLTSMQSVAERIAAENDLTLTMPQSGRDEIGQTSRAFGTMLGRFRELISVARRDAGEVAAFASEMHEMSGQLAIASQTQADAAASTASAVDELTASINLVVNNTAHLLQSAESVGAQASQGNTLAGQTAAQVANVAEALDQASAAVSALDARSGEIGGIVQVIKEIADQTNLLALNAAIEAARAGEQGRGFAVVADEVRKLAERTGSATTDISRLIDSVRNETSDAHHRMRNANAGIEQGVDSARRVAEALASIQASSQETVAKLREISLSMQEEGQAINLISSHVEHIAQMSEENHAAAKSAEEVSARLGELAKGLDVQIARFKV